MRVNATGLLEGRMIVFAALNHHIVSAVFIDGNSTSLAAVNASAGTRPIGFIARGFIARKRVVTHFEFATAAEAGYVGDEKVANWWKNKQEKHKQIRLIWMLKRFSNRKLSKRKEKKIHDDNK